MSRKQAIARHLAAHRDADTPPFGKYDGEVACPDGLVDILAACVRQALADYRTGYVGFRMPDAATFLRSAGILTDDGLDRHGYHWQERIARKVAVRLPAAGEE